MYRNTILHIYIEFKQNILLGRFSTQLYNIEVYYDIIYIVFIYIIINIQLIRSI